MFTFAYFVEVNRSFSKLDLVRNGEVFFYLKFCY